RHGHLVATDPPIVIADDGNACRHDVLGQIAIDQIALAPRSAHVAVTLHEPAPRHHQDGRVRSGSITGRQIDLSGEPCPAVAGGYLELLRFHVTPDRVSAAPRARSGCPPDRLPNRTGHSRNSRLGRPRAPRPLEAVPTWHRGFGRDNSP